MRAVVIHAPKDLRIDTLADAPAPGPNEVQVAIKAGGICGSDLHYYNHGGFGVVRVKEPMALGHEIAGVVSAVGSEVSHLAVGARVAVNPSRPCNQCEYCLRGMRNHCLDMRFLGSAMRFPHVQGGFRELMTVDAFQAVPVADNVTLGEAAMAEPMAVCLHAANQAGPLLGRRVLVTGSGPIGALCVVAARLGGAAEIVVTDVSDQPLAASRSVGATRTVNVAREASALDAYKAGKGTFDVLFECSGNQAALVSALDVLRPGGVIVQVGLGGEATLPINTIVAKELQLRGTFRFDAEFELAVRLMGQGLIDVKPLITATVPFAEAVQAFELANDRSRAMKVQLAF
ncbi:L-idonate 5-dehydrogenase [Alsobacter soli]|uniref:L-idonate 5-dehydrogenase n=1 Tax=Alsobacter soli TaxID=2109933 RepID=A0A2T1HMI4_9HYPH|nr:L-idonate 5-dehydrogenase [Alsobacter soli]PSC02789.1 L-idonate 5-dehydrogenase [Alsobacter soli]